MSSYEFKHQNIGVLHGLRKSEHVAQFLGLRYAHLVDRFARGTLCTYAKEADIVVDASEVGPLGAIPFDSCEHEQRLIQKSLLPTPAFQYCDTDCLTLNISVPLGHDHGKVPVLVFVHGGAFTTGSSSFPQCDLGRLTEMSVRVGLPLIAVGVNYRVGIPGFLCSPEMQSAGYEANNGLHDQRLALSWIRQHIGGFGGDETRVTFLGESAGATSGFLHLHQKEPLFQQLVLMSGGLIFRPQSAQSMSKIFKVVAHSLELDSLGQRDQVRSLVQASTHYLIKTGRIGGLRPAIDGDIIPDPVTYETIGRAGQVATSLPGSTRLSRVLVGSCGADAAVWASRLRARRDILPVTLNHCLSTVLGKFDASLAAKVASIYGIDARATTNSAENVQAVLNFGTDIVFAVAAIYGARSLASAAVGVDVFRYRFECPNPWPGPGQGQATHVLDLAFVLQNYAEALAPGQRECAKTFASDIIEFVHGKPLWRPLRVENSAEEVMVYDADANGDIDKSRLVSENSAGLEGLSRESLLMKAASPKALDSLLNAWNMFMEWPNKKSNDVGGCPLRTGMIVHADLEYLERDS